MSLTEKDLRAIKDIVDFSIEKSEIRMDVKMDRRFAEFEERIDKKIDKKIVEVVERIDREVTDIAEMNREFLGKLDNHENRIGKLELNTGLIVK